MGRFSTLLLLSGCFLIVAACTSTGSAGGADTVASSRRTVSAGYEFASIPDGLAAAGESYSYTVQAAPERPGGKSGAWEYSLIDAPEGMKLADNTITWLPASDDAGEHEILIAARNARGEERFQRFILSVTEKTAWRRFGMGGGGWMTAAAFSTTEPDTVYLGCDVGGFYRSIDGGLTWRNKNRGLTDYYFQCLLVHPEDGDIIWAGTNSGVFKTIDGGESWRPMRSGFPEPAENDYSGPVSALAIDPNAPDTLYAGIGRPRFGDYGKGTVYASTDGGESWSPRTAGLDRSAIITALAVDIGNPALVYAGTDRGLYRSADAGGTWSLVSHELPHQRISDVDVTPGGTVYAVLETDLDSDVWIGGVYRSDDGGASWRAKNGGLHAWLGPSRSLDTVSTYSNLIIDPYDSETLYIADTSWGTVGIYRSANGAESWRLIMDVRESKNVDHGWITFFGPSPNGVALNPHNREHVLFGTDGQVIETRDGGTSWHPVYTRRTGPDSWATTGIETTCLWDIAVHPARPERIFRGYYDISLLRTDDGGKSFISLREEFDAGYRCNSLAVTIDPDNPDIVYASGGPPGDEADLHGRIFRSVDGGIRWHCTASEDNGFPGGLIRHIVIDPSSPTDERTLYASSTPNGVFKSIDGGRSWTEKNNGLPRENLRISCLEMDAGNPHMLYAAVRPDNGHPGGLYRSVNGGSEWTPLDVNTYFRDIYALAIDPADSNTLYVGTQRRWDGQDGRMYYGGIYKTTDAGESWRRLPTEPPARERIAVFDIIVDPRDTERVYAACFDYPYHDFPEGEGILVSRDGGESWETLNEGLPIRSVETIELDSATHTLYAGTIGSGVYVRKLE